MPCPFCAKSHNPFQESYNNGGNKLYLRSMPTLRQERSNTILARGSIIPSYVKLTASVELMSAKDGKELTISGDVDLVLELLEKLK